MSRGSYDGDFPSRTSAIRNAVVHKYASNVDVLSCPGNQDVT